MFRNRRGRGSADFGENLLGSFALIHPRMPKAFSFVFSAHMWLQAEAWLERKGAPMLPAILRLL
jgi:hypothetical protein